MVYKPTNITGGPHPVAVIQMGGFDMFSFFSVVIYDDLPI